MPTVTPRTLPVPFRRQRINPAIMHTTAIPMNGIKPRDSSGKRIWTKWGTNGRTIPARTSKTPIP